MWSTSMSQFKDMKIHISTEQPLVSVLAALERLGYEPWRYGGFIVDAFNDCSIRTFDWGGYTDIKSKQVYDSQYTLTTLDELRGML